MHINVKAIPFNNNYSCCNYYNSVHNIVVCELKDMEFSLLIYGADGLQNLRFTKIYTAAHKI